MIVLPAAGIETSLTRRTARMTLEVLRYRQCFAAGTTQNSLLGKLTAWPHLGSMISCSFMALVTSVVRLTAFEFDGDTIQLAVVMGTAGLCIYRHATHGDAMNAHPHKGLTGTNTGNGRRHLGEGHEAPMWYLSGPNRGPAQSTVLTETTATHKPP